MTLASNIGQGSYNNYDGLSLYSYNTIKYLKDNNELIWKLLHYTTANAWNEAALNSAQKASMIYSGQPDTNKYNVFMARGMPDARITQCSILTISPSGISPTNRTVGIVDMLFEVYAHYQIQTLDNYTIRSDVIIEEIIKTLNGKEFLKGLGKFFFSQMGSKMDKDSDYGVTPFRGKWLFMSTKIG
jgi:hypothetical protein